jgi:hypothetical protein
VLFEVFGLEQLFDPRRDLTDDIRGRVGVDLIPLSPKVLRVAIDCLADSLEPLSTAMLDGLECVWGLFEGGADVGEGLIVRLLLSVLLLVPVPVFKAFLESGNALESLVELDIGLSILILKSPQNVEGVKTHLPHGPEGIGFQGVLEGLMVGLGLLELGEKLFVLAAHLRSLHHLAADRVLSLEYLLEALLLGGLLRSRGGSLGGWRRRWRGLGRLLLGDGGGLLSLAQPWDGGVGGGDGGSERIDRE